MATEMTIKIEAGGTLFVKLPFPTWLVTEAERTKIKVEKGIAEMKRVKGQIITFTNVFE